MTCVQLSHRLGVDEHERHLDITAYALVAEHARCEIAPPGCIDVDAYLLVGYEDLDLARQPDSTWCTPPVRR